MRKIHRVDRLGKMGVELSLRCTANMFGSRVGSQGDRRDLSTLTRSKSPNSSDQTVSIFVGHCDITE